MSQTKHDPENAGTSRRNWWWLAALVGAGIVALVVYLAVRTDDTMTTADTTDTTETNPATDSGEMTDDMSDETPMDDSTTDMSPDDMSTSDMSDGDMSDGEASVDESAQDQISPNTSPGVYRDFSEDLLAAPGYQRNILFVHAGWCPECRAFDESLNNADIPAGVQFLKIDYDSNRDELKREYGVDIQSTFVEVDDQGEKVSLWVGYGKNRSLDAIFEGLDEAMDG